MSKYVISGDDIQAFKKFGMDIKVYGQINDEITFVKSSVKVGHLEEFKNTSWFTYFIINGRGIFYLNDEEIKVKSGDLVTIPPNTRIYYFGSMEYTLTVNPPWKEENETHIRDIDPNDSPFNNSSKKND